MALTLSSARIFKKISWGKVNGLFCGPIIAAIGTIETSYMCHVNRIGLWSVFSAQSLRIITNPIYRGATRFSLYLITNHTNM